MHSANEWQHILPRISRASQSVRIQDLWTLVDMCAQLVDRCGYEEYIDQRFKCDSFPAVMWVGIP